MPTENSIIREIDEKVSQLLALSHAGVDEVGRGPLVGNVVAAAVILDPTKPIKGLADSKKLTDKIRQKLAIEIKEQALSFAIGFASVSEIIELNILQASLLAMERAIMGLSIKPQIVFIDGNKIPNCDYKCLAVIKGDSKIEAISAASILAKVTRDQEMYELDKIYPQYGFAKHKGYPTKEHLTAVNKFGIFDGYRLTYKPIVQYIQAHQKV